MGSGSVEWCLHREKGGCEAGGPGPGAQLAGRGQQPPSLSPPSARPRSNIFCLWNKTSKWDARLDHPGRRAEERSFQKDEPRPQQASAQLGRLLWLVGLRRPQRPRPCPSHRADFPGGGRFNGWRQDCSQRPGVARCLRLFSQTPACLAFRYLPPSFHRVLPAERSRPARGSA